MFTGKRFCMRIGSALYELWEILWMIWSSVSQSLKLGWIYLHHRVFDYKISLVFPILLFSSISLHWSLRKAISPCYSLELCIQMGISFLFSFAFCFSSFHSFCKASLGNHFALLHFFVLGMVLITASCIVSQTSVHSSSGSLSIRSNPLNLFVPSSVSS